MFNVGDSVKCTCGCTAVGSIVPTDEAASRPEWSGMAPSFFLTHVAVKWEDDDGFTTYEFVRPEKLKLLQARRKKIERNLPAWF